MKKQAIKKVAKSLIRKGDLEKESRYLAPVPYMATKTAARTQSMIRSDWFLYRTGILLLTKSQLLVSRNWLNGESIEYV